MVTGGPNLEKSPVEEFRSRERNAYVPGPASGWKLSARRELSPRRHAVQTSPGRLICTSSTSPEGGADSAQVTVNVELTVPDVGAT